MASTAVDTDVMLSWRIETSSWVAVGLERFGDDGNLRMLFILVPGSLGLAAMAMRATTEVGPRG